MTLSFFITVIPDHDKPQPPGCLLEVLKPCIVCFRADIDYEKGALEAALSYAYTSVRELPPDSGAVFGIDRHGKSVSVDEIVNVEFI